MRWFTTILTACWLFVAAVVLFCVHSCRSDMAARWRITTKAGDIFEGTHFVAGSSRARITTVKGEVYVYGEFKAEKISE